MSLRNCLDYFNKAVRQIDDYGFAESNARHLPDVGFKEHKHLNDGSIVESSIPDISDVVDKVIEYIR